MKMRESLGWIVFFIIAGLAIYGWADALCFGITWIEAQSYAGQKYDVVVTVQASEQSTRFGEHTNVWVQVYGDQDITYNLIGFHDFETGKKYRIVFVDEAYLCFFVIHWFEVRGRVTSIELIEG